MDTIILVVIGVIGIAALLLMTQKWFWVLAFGIGGLASAFSTLASIFHFQILAALGYFFLISICWGIAMMINDS